METNGSATAHRSGAFDLYRILFAFLVLWAHSYELDPRQPQWNIFSRLRVDLNWGVVAVDGFFFLSGLLIVQSWLRDPRLGDYLQKRLLRIVPGYMVAVALSVLTVGLFAPAVPHFFMQSMQSVRFWVSIALLDSPITAPAFPGAVVRIVNGSLWTVTYEARCYLLVAILGVSGLLRRRLIWLALTTALFLLSLSPTTQAHLSWNRYVLLIGRPSGGVYRFFSVFMVGGAFALYRDKVSFRPLFASLSLAGLIAIPLLPRPSEPWMVLFGGYLLLHLADQPFAPFRMWRSIPDLSYGIYLYGWPIQAFLIWRYHLTYYANFLIAALSCTLLGWLSWHFVERPALMRKPGRSVELPASN